MWYLRLVGLVSLLAFVAALMPAAWIVKIADELGLPPFPETPIAFYLARHLSLLYGFIGIALTMLSFQLSVYRAHIGYLATSVIAFGVLQAAIDYHSGMPLGWTAEESISTIVGGLIMLWLHHRCD